MRADDAPRPGSKYCKPSSKSAAFGNFKFFRPTATDLYVLTHMALHVNGSVGLIVGRSLLRLYKGLGKGSVDSQLAEQTLLRLERSLQIKDARLRQARRVLTHWGTSSEDEQKNTTTNLHRIVRMYAKLAEVLPYLQSAVAREPGHFGKMTVGQTALAIAGAGLAGVALGLQYDPNKRWRIFRDSTVFDGSKILTEDRPTQLFHIVQNLKHHPDIEKIISVHYLADGITSLVRSTDGNAYELEIRPAPFANSHDEKRGVTEENGWEWRCMDVILEHRKETTLHGGTKKANASAVIALTPDDLNDDHLKNNSRGAPDSDEEVRDFLKDIRDRYDVEIVDDFLKYTGQDDNPAYKS